MCGERLIKMTEDVGNRTIEESDGIALIVTNDLEAVPAGLQPALMHDSFVRSYLQPNQTWSITR